jgi:hypothetical protein
MYDNDIGSIKLINPVGKTNQRQWLTRTLGQKWDQVPRRSVITWHTLRTIIDFISLVKKYKLENGANTDL